MSDKEALDLYVSATDEEVDCDDAELVHEIVDSVRKVRVASGEEEAMSAILWWGHSEDWTRRIVNKIRKA